MDPIVGHRVEHARCLVELKIQALPSSQMDRFEGLDTVEMDTRLNRMNKDTQAIQFENIGYLKSRFTDDELAPLRQEVLKVSANFESSRRHNNKLAGNLRHSYLLSDEMHRYVYRLVAPLVLEFDQSFAKYVTQNSIAPENSPIYLKELWANFQNKDEFNPPHDHYGILSFVIWLKIPYSMQEELQLSPGADSNNNVSGKFCFQYTNSLGDICNHFISADRSLENQVLLFSGKMKHSVFPFYSSDDYRISVAGNFAIKGKND